MNALYRPAWFTVLTVALAMSWWSLFVVATHYQVPPVLAAGVSAIFDGAALICANLAHRYATSPHSGAGPRWALIALLGGSVYLNVHHAQLEGWGLPAQVMFSGPAVVAVLLFELEQSWRNREHRLAAGRIAPSLPVVGRWGWLFYPLRSLGVLRKVTAHRLATLAVEYVTGVDRPDQVTATATATVTDTPADHDQPTAVLPKVTAPALPATAPAQPAPRDQVTAGDRVTDPRAPVTGQDDDQVKHRREVKTAASTADAVAYAVSVTGHNRPAPLARWLTAHGRETTPEAVRSALRRGARDRSDRSPGRAA